jgi:hypothetical protein
MSKLLTFFSFIIILTIGCSTDVKEAESQNSETPISQEEIKEIESVDNMIKRDKERVDSMEKALLEQMKD